MQTFLPYPSFRRSAEVLDDRRLGKQRVEALQILDACLGRTSGWATHPAVAMWRGYEEALVLYGLQVCGAWVRRGYADTVAAKLAVDLPPGWRRPRRLPPWLGDPALHRSHRSALVRKDPAFYGPRFPGVPPDLPYVWPAGAAPEDTMAEGPTVHRIAREQAAALAGRRVAVSSPQGRFATEAARLDGRRLRAVEARGKHLLYRWDGDDVVEVHLGLLGRFDRHAVPPPPPARYVRMRLAGPDAAFDLVAPNQCALRTPAEVDALLARLGPDPLAPGADPDAAWAAIRGRRRPIGALLLDQAAIAGVGNVLRAEALWEAGVHPERAAATLTREDFDRIWGAIARLMEKALAEGRILPAVPPGADPATVPEIETRRVYKRERCGACGGPVETAEVGGRTSYACPRCQPREGFVGT